MFRTTSEAKDEVWCPFNAFRSKVVLLIWFSVIAWFLVKTIIGNPNFSDLLKCIVNRFKRAGYTLDIMRKTACLVFSQIMVECYAALFSCTAVVQASDLMTAVM